MTTVNYITQALKSLIPNSTTNSIEELAALLLELIETRPTTISTRNTIQESEDLQDISNKLRGTNILISNALVSFGEQSQIGDVRIRDVIGGNKVDLAVHFHFPSQTIIPPDFTKINDNIHTEEDLLNAKRVLIFLEDRRVLYTNYEDEQLRSSKASVEAIRMKLSDFSERVRPDSQLASYILTMRASCRKFLSSIDKINVEAVPAHIHWGSIEREDIVFLRSLEELRSVFIDTIEKIAFEYKISIPGDLNTARRYLKIPSHLLSVRGGLAQPTKAESNQIEQDASVTKIIVPGAYFAGRITEIDASAVLIEIPGYSINDVVGVMPSSKMGGRRYRVGNIARVQVTAVRTLRNGLVVVELVPLSRPLGD